MKDDIKGPYIIWLNYGAYEGWKPTSFNTIKEALESEKYSNEWVITKPVEYEVRENGPQTNQS